MTAGSRNEQPGRGSGLSVRGWRIPSPTRIGLGLALLVVVTIVVDGGRGFLPAYPRGDLLYHWGLTHAVLRGEIPPGGPYAGLPAYYPPGFHLLIAATSAVTGWALPAATLVLGFLWLPVLPIATFLLARRVTGRGEIALLAATVTVFAGGYDFAGDRLWVNSLFLAGHQMYPLYPRDLVFGLLPLAILAFIRALEDEHGLRWAIVAGGLFGACALIQIQILLPIPLAILAVAVVPAVVDRTRRRAAALAVVVTGGVATLLTALWLIPTIAVIRRNGGVALDSAEGLVPARIGFWEYPRQFGLLLPLAVAGLGVVLIHLRQRNRQLTGLTPRSPWSGLVLLPWFVVPWALAVLYDPGWPLEDALRPQRLWLLASQPAAILAAIGLWSLARHVARRRRLAPRWTMRAIVAVVLVMAVPTVAFTIRQLAQTWTQPVYAALRLDVDRVPDMAAVLGDRGPRSTVLTYEDWSSLAWYETGSWVVAVNPPGYAKLAFDPKTFTGQSQNARRLAVGRAFDGQPSELTAVADEFGASRVLVARRGDRWGLIQQVATTVARHPDRVSGGVVAVDGNGWDAEKLAPGARLVIVESPPDRQLALEIRLAGLDDNRGVGQRRFRLVGVDGGSERVIAELVAPATATDDWQVVGTEVDLRPGERLAIEAIDPITVQSVLGFAAAAVPDGWRVERITPDAVVLARNP